jgi:ABC-2 type transport system permease protein
MIGTIARREAQALFRAPLAWVVLAATQIIVSWQFLALLDIFMEEQPRLRALANPPGITQAVCLPTFGVTAMVMVLLAPVLTMHTLSGERRSGALKLYLSAPVSATEIVLGKFFGLLALGAVVWLLNALMAATLAWGTALDYGTLGAALLGLALLVMATLAVGLLFSSLTSQPALAATGTFGFLLLIWMVDWQSGQGKTAGLLAWLSMPDHFQRLSQGLLDTADVEYFLLLTLGMLLLAIWRLDGDRRAF